MTDPRWKQLADVLVNYSTGTKQGEKVLITMMEETVRGVGFGLGAGGSSPLSISSAVPSVSVTVFQSIGFTVLRSIKSQVMPWASRNSWAWRASTVM